MLLCVSIDEHDRRVTELIAANNREVERRRAAEAEVERLRATLDQIIGLASTATAQPVDPTLKPEP